MVPSARFGRKPLDSSSWTPSANCTKRYGAPGVSNRMSRGGPIDRTRAGRSAMVASYASSLTQIRVSRSEYGVSGPRNDEAPVGWEALCGVFFGGRSSAAGANQMTHRTEQPK